MNKTDSKKNKTKEILVFNPFKVGSSTLEYILNRMENTKATKFHAYDLKQQTRVPPENVHSVILVYRNPIELYMSAFFEDCTQSAYPYYYGTQEQVRSATAEQLVNHFNKFDWTQYQWLNYGYYIEQLNKIFDVDKNDVWSFINSNEKYKVLNGRHNAKNVVCLLLKTKHLYESVDVINSALDVELKKMECHRAAKNRWYFSKYKEFKELMAKKLNDNSKVTTAR